MERLRYNNKAGDVIVEKATGRYYLKAPWSVSRRLTAHTFGGRRMPNGRLFVAYTNDIEMYEPGENVVETEFNHEKNNNEREDKNMNKNFTKADLKVGYVVKYRNGNLRMVMPYAGGLAFTTIDGLWLNIGTELNDDLTEKKGIFEGDGILDVMEVYGLNTYGSRTCDISTDDRELLWKREEPPKKTCDKCIHKVVCSHVGMCEHYMEGGASK